MRAREPDRCGRVERRGVRIGYEVFGEGAETLLFMPTWSIIHSRTWKGQIPYFSRHFRVVTFDGRGSGRSDRPTDPASYREEEFAADALRVMDATETDRALVVSLSMGAIRSLMLAAEHPDRVCGLAFIAPSLRLTPLAPERASISFTDRSTARRVGRSSTGTSGGAISLVSSSSSSPACSPSRTPPSRSRTASGGLWRAIPRR
jgi:pimeloyl-ACP methyl ester carboxylesterase